jgi:hypothetical protein
VKPCSTDFHAGSRAAELMFFSRSLASFGPFYSNFPALDSSLSISLAINTWKQYFNIRHGLEVGHTRGLFENAYQYLLAPPREVS